MKKIIVLFILLASPISIADAAPSITSATISGTSISVSGSDFGTKATSAPKKFDDFEEGVHGDRLFDHNSAWSIYAGTGHLYTNTVAHSGSLAVGSVIPNGEWFASNYYTFTPSGTEMYITYWWRTVDADAGDTTIIKLPRITSTEAAGGGGTYTGTGNMTLGGTYNLSISAGPYCAYNNGVDNEVFYTPSGTAELDFPPNNTWMRVEMFKKLSTAGGTDGVAEVRIFGVDSAVNNAATTRGAGQTFTLDNVYLGLSDGSEGNHSYSMYLDDMYIDVSRARVEICDTDTWAARTHCEIQIPTAWGATAISATVNQGSFANNSTVYLYVVDSDGAANSSGVEVIFGTPPVSLGTFPLGLPH